MKYVVVLTRRDGITPDRFAKSARAEVLAVWQGIKSGTVRSVSSIVDGGGALLELECGSGIDAHRFIEELPFVQEGLLDAKYFGLAPYSGLEQLFSKD